MKTTTLLLAILASSFSYGAQTLVHSMQLSGNREWDGDYTIRYDADERSGRAWVEAEISYELVDDYYSKRFKFKLPGLKLVGDNVVYQANGISKTCGTLGKGFLTKKRIVKQKYRRKAACRMKMELRETTIDSGFDFKDIYVADFYMVTK